MNKIQKEIPIFKTEDEEREFWSKHDSTEYVDWDKAKVGVLPNLKPSLNKNRLHDNLNQDEQELLDSYENNEWVVVTNPFDMTRYKEAAQNTFKEMAAEQEDWSDFDVTLLDGLEDNDWDS